jgi:carboxyl-terminal processing protease
MKMTRKRLPRLLTTMVTVSFSLFLIFAPTASAQSLSSVEVQNYLARFQYIFQYVLQSYVNEVDPQTLYEGALNGLFSTLEDPYSYYLTEEDLEDMSGTTVGRYGGVGLYISRPLQPEKGETDEISLPPQDERPFLDATSSKSLPYIRVVAPIEGTPAYRQGIHAGDYIIGINGRSTVNLNTDEAADILRGLPGTDVNITILRGRNITFEVTLTRAQIEIPTVKEAMIPGEIGYIRVIQFTPFTHQRIKEALDNFSSRNYQGLIIDVRGNPGGLLRSVVDTMDLFLPSGTIVSTKSRIPEENEFFSAGPQVSVSEDLPVVVLIDEGSASASEILAGAFKDTGRGYLIGDTSFGKGTVQKVIPLGREGFKLTISRYYTPAGIDINATGIEPHLKIVEPELSDEENESLKRIFEERLVEEYVNTNPKATEQQQRAFARELQQEGINLDFDLLMRIIRNELFRRVDVPPVYDLEYDPPLKKAVEMLRAGEISRELEAKK